MISRLRTVAFAITVLFATSTLAISLVAWQWLNTDIDLLTDDKHYHVPQGASLYAVSRDLGEKGFIRWPKLWVYYARLSQQIHIKAGEYEFAQRISPRDILVVLNTGKVIQHKVALIEGTRFQDFVSKLQAHEKIIKTFDIEDHKSALESVGIDIAHPEGWFYPDTYLFSLGDTDISILRRAHEKLKQVLQEEWEDRQHGLPYENSYEALTMASIVEKETGVPEERDEIAGVFVRRLNMGMRLQTDPTVIYGMGQQYTGNITRKDLKMPTPYNTYVIKGLPPTPIAMAGREAINAALNPKEGSSLYFVAKGDGTHYFSETLQQHNRAVEIFQKNRRKDYRSTPPKNTEVKSEG